MPHQPYHIVDQSPWPLLSSINILSLAMSLILFIKQAMLSPLLLSLLCLSFTTYLWWRDVVRESTFQGFHTNQVTKGLKIGMLLFIISEIMFFISFFWTFFHSSLSPNIQIGAIWPPKNISTFNPLLIPLLNTTILISSGISVTWSHHSLLNSNLSQSKNALFLTVILGLYFSLLQGWEYNQAPFSMSDSIYGSTFFIATGFHGLHVLIGTSFLLIMMIRTSTFQFSSHHHIGFEMAAWYWHFVDLVWLFLYISIYWWGT